MDLARELIAEDHGAGRSTPIAQELVMFLRRGASHSQFSSFPSTQASSNLLIEDLCGWIADHLGMDLTFPRWRNDAG